MGNVILRATTKKPIQRGILKILQIYQNRILKNVQVTHRMAWKIKQRNEEQKEQTKTKWQTKSLHISIATLNVKNLNMPIKKWRFGRLD